MMNQEDIARMAREAGFSEQDGIVTGGVSDLERFAALVRADEREACAKLADDIDPVWESVSVAIRAGSNT